MSQNPDQQITIDQPGDDLMAAALSGSGGAVVERGGQLVSERSLFGDVITAQPIKVPRDEARILRKIDVMAAAAGEAWFYRFPVKDRKRGTTNYIEGISIDGADAVSRYFGNCRIDAAVVDTGPAWIIYGRFIDLETGYTLIRPFLQSKSGARLGGDDDERRLQIAMGIGCSKAQRNVIDHALRDFTTRAFERAKQNLVERVGAKLPEYRTRCIERIKELGGDELLKRVERVYGRASGDWLAPDIARIIVELRDIGNGMTSVDEAWAPPPPPEPSRSDDVTDIIPAGGVPNATEPSAAAGPSHPAAAAAPAAPAAPSAASEPASDRGPRVGAVAPAEPPADELPAALRNWSLPPTLLGQDAVLKGLDDLLDMTADAAELNELLGQNAERIAKITGNRRLQWDAKVKARRERFAQGGAP